MCERLKQAVLKITPVPSLVFGINHIVRASRPVFGQNLCTSGVTVQQEKLLFRPLDQTARVQHFGSRRLFRAREYCQGDSLARDSLFIFRKY